jgi:hypothetical protein
MDSSRADEPRLHDHYALCGAAIRWGDRVVTIARYEEQVRADGDIEVIRAEVRVSLCEACGRRNPTLATRLELGGQSFTGARWPEAQ